MTLHEKCISVSKAVTDMLLKSKSMKVALIATIWPDKNRTFCSMLSSKRLDVLEGQEFLPCQQLPHPKLLDRNHTLTFSTEYTSYLSRQCIS